MKLLSLAGTIVLLTATVYAQEEERRAKPPTGSYPPPGAATYDYVIVGGGTAGLTLAARLSEDRKNSVAVVEAGSFYEESLGNISQVPATWYFHASPDPAAILPFIDWGYVTQPQPGLNGRSVHYAQGKCFGGSSSLNGMLYHRPPVGYFQRWVDTVGDGSYAFDSVFPYFKKSVAFTPPDQTKLGSGVNVPFDPAAFDPSGGPLDVSYSNFYQPFSPEVFRAFESIGLSPNPGLNSGKLIGVTHMTVTIDPRTATRESSATSFLRQALDTSPLQVYNRTLAKKILFDKKKTSGVLVETEGTEYTLKAKKEVIVSAGVFNTPQLLMVSGIGPKATLDQFQIPVVVDSQGVGQNMWDHSLYGLTYQVNLTALPNFNKEAYTQALENYRNSQSGPFSSVGADIFGFEKLPEPFRSSLDAAALSELSQFPSDWPEIELVPFSFGVGDGNSLALTFLVALVAPLSRGTVTITSSNINDKPLINPNLFSSPTDQKIAVQAFRRARQLINATGITTGSELSVPGPLETDEQILEGIKGITAAFYHATSTCTMGKKGDPKAVVDSEGLVFGIDGLRIVDASVLPFTPPGHPQSVVYMLAEKLADVINKRKR